jgi:hypothetical protein
VGRTKLSGHPAHDRILASTKDRSRLTSKTRDAFPCGLDGGHYVDNDRAQSDTTPVWLQRMSCTVVVWPLRA